MIAIGEIGNRWRCGALCPGVFVFLRWRVSCGGKFKSHGEQFRQGKGLGFATRRFFLEKWINIKILSKIGGAHLECTLGDTYITYGVFLQMHITLVVRLRIYCTIHKNDVCSSQKYPETWNCLPIWIWIYFLNWSNGLQMASIFHFEWFLPRSRRRLTNRTFEVMKTIDK